MAAPFSICFLMAAVSNNEVAVSGWDAPTIADKQNADSNQNL
jgi:hypothetical protein